MKKLENDLLEMELVDTLDENEVDEVEVEVDENGQIMLDPTEVPVVKVAKVAKAKPEPKPFKGFTSNIFSNGKEVDSLIAMLNVLSAIKVRENIEDNYKMSTYKNEFRFAFENLSTLQVRQMMTEEEIEIFDEINVAPDEKNAKFFSIVIA